MPKFSLKSVYLAQCEIRQNPDFTQQGPVRYNLQISSFYRLVRSEGKSLCVFSEFDLTAGVSPSPLTFKCLFLSGYYRDEVSDWIDLKDHVALAHVFPYLREFVSNMTSRMMFPVLMIPPMDVNQMLSAYNERVSALKNAEESRPTEMEATKRELP